MRDPLAQQANGRIGAGHADSRYRLASPTICEEEVEEVEAVRQVLFSGMLATERFEQHFEDRQPVSPWRSHELPVTDFLAMHMGYAYALYPVPREAYTRGFGRVSYGTPLEVTVRREHATGRSPSRRVLLSGKRILDIGCAVCWRSFACH